MTNIKPLADLCDWKLMRGSHKWPGPQGGTCINEAAIVASGLAYRSVSSASDCPSCFCPVISSYLIQINDGMDDKNRQKLQRFVLRLSGSADSQEVEQMRLEYIVTETVKRIVSVAMDAAKLPEWAATCRAVTTFIEAREVAAAAADAAADAARYAARDKIADECIAIIDGALAIGNQADAIEVSVALDRMEKSRRASAVA